MTEFHYLRDLLILFGLGVIAVIFCHRARIPPVAGFLLTGVACGPFGFGLIELGEVQLLAEFGVVLLLFTVGIEFSFQQIAHLRTFLLAGGSLQVGLTIGLTALGLRVFGVPLTTGTFLGMLLALSSTAIVIRLLAERGEIDSPHGRGALGISIFQDLCLVPMLLLAPFLAGGQQDWTQVIIASVKAVAFVALAVILARHVVPRLLHLVVQTRNREAFILTIIFLCLGTAWFTAAVGLSLALGAFIAGLVISESEYSQQALGEILPFREVFNSLFFVSIGMLLDVRTLLASPGLIFSGIVLATLLKALVMVAAIVAVERSVRVAVLTAFLMAQIGEFSFVLSRSGLNLGLLDASLNQIFLAVAVGTMAMSPGFFALGRWLAPRAESLLPAGWCSPVEQPAAAKLRDHVIIVGYGINGRNVARVLDHVRIPFTVIDIGPESLRSRSKELSFVYGDATRPEILLHAGIDRARVLVVAISDAAATRRATDLARRLNPGIHVIVRTRYVREMEPLFAAGAQDVVPEEFETSIEIFSRVLERYLVPRDLIEQAIWQVRQDGYEMFRATFAAYTTHRPAAGIQRFLSDMSMEVYRVQPGSVLAGRRLREVGLRQKFGVTVLAIQHPDGSAAANPAPDEVIAEQDSLLLLAPPAQLAQCAALFGPGPAGVSAAET